MSIGRAETGDAARRLFVENCFSMLFPDVRVVDFTICRDWVMNFPTVRKMDR